MYDTDVEYTYQCDECHKPVTNSRHHRSCTVCSINLCNNCYKKRGVHLCLWCYNKNSDANIWQMKIIRIMTIFIPILILLIPTPVPLIYRILVWDNTDNLLIVGIVLLIISIGIFIILQNLHSDKMKKHVRIR